MSTQSLFEQPSLNFPQSLTEKYRPLTIDAFAGLEKPKNIMRKLAAKPFESAWLFVGPSGTGKTTMGLALAAAIPAELHHIPSQDCNLENIERVRRICQYVPMAGFKFHLVLVDEADRMTQAAQISLLSKLDATIGDDKMKCNAPCYVNGSSPEYCPKHIKRIAQWDALSKQVRNLSDDEAAGLARYLCGYLSGNAEAYRAFTAGLERSASVPAADIVRHAEELYRSDHPFSDADKIIGHGLGVII